MFKLSYIPVLTAVRILCTDSVKNLNQKTIRFPSIISVSKSNATSVEYSDVISLLVTGICLSSGRRKPPAKGNP